MVLNIHIGQPNILSNFHSPFRWMFSAGFGGFAIPRSAGCLARGSADLQSAASEYQHLCSVGCSARGSVDFRIRRH